MTPMGWPNEAGYKALDAEIARIDAPYLEIL